MGLPGDIFNVNLDFLAWGVNIGGVGLISFLFAGMTLDATGSIQNFVDSTDTDGERGCALG